MTFAPADINRLMDNARINLPGALDGAIQLEMFNLLNDFFQATNIWTEDITFAVTTANILGSTTLIVPSSGVINRLMYVITADRSQRNMGMREPGVLEFIDVPGTSETWTARVALTVTDPIPTTGKIAGFPQAPGWILAKYSNGLLDGLLGRMMMQVSKSYSNPRLGTMKLRNYNNAVATARSEARHQNLYGGQTWKFPGFARGHQNSRGI